MALKKGALQMEYGYLQAVDLPVEEVIVKIESDAQQVQFKHQSSESNIQRQYSVYRKFATDSPMQALKAFSFVILKYMQSKGKIKPRKLFGMEVKDISVRSAINLLLGFKGKL